MSDTCDKCRWYGAVDSECHRFPPANYFIDTVTRSTKIKRIVQRMRFPCIEAPTVTWCGEFTTRAEESDNGIITEEPTPF